MKTCLFNLRFLVCGLGLAMGLAAVAGSAQAGSAKIRHDLKEGLAMIDYDAVYLDKMVVKIKEGYELDFTANGAMAIAGESFALNLKPQFTASRYYASMEDTFSKERAARAAGILPEGTIDLSGYVRVSFAAPLSVAEAKAALADVFEQPEVEFAHFESHAATAVILSEDIEPSSFNYPVAPSRGEPTPDFEGRQDYLEASPKGVNARYGWEQEGGTGKGIHVVDVEGAWVIDHEDFNPPFWERVPNGPKGGIDHGTAVWGIVAAKKDGKGVSGIAHGVEFGTSHNTMDATAFISAADRLKKEKLGVMIIELHRKGPDNGKFAPWEYWQVSFDAFKKITSEYKVHVIAAAGNGNSNLDSDAYKGAFDLSKRDSGSVLVGAAGPSTGNNHLKRLNFSNYGSRLDTFGYGRNVASTGYGNLFGKGNPQREYTKSFGGTSSATPIVVGASCSAMGILLAKGKVIEPLQLRKALRETGAKQKGNADKERIGNLPNVEELAKYLDQQF